MTAVAEPLIALEGVTLAYRARDRARRALHEASLATDAGEIVSIEGPPGAGKTTLLLVAAGLLTPDAGAVRFEGESLATLSSGRRRELRRSSI